MRHVGHIGRLQFGGQLAFPLIAAILEPDLHLRLGQPERGGQTCSFRGAKVALQIERGLQLEDLGAREYSSGFLLSLRVAITMWRGAVGGSIRTIILLDDLLALLVGFVGTAGQQVSAM